MLKSSLLALLTLAVAAPSFAQTQPMDPDFAAHVKEWTTKPEFSSPLVDHLPVSTTVPSPRSILGYDIGTPKKLTYYADITRYYQALAAASPRVRILNLGKTEEGRENIMVFIGSEDSIAHLEDNRKNLARLADPRGLSAAEAQQIIAHTKPLYTFSGGLHSAELGPPEMLMELAYRLVTEDSDLIRKIRENVIVSILPAADPDGRDRNIDWYNKYLIDVTTQGGPGMTGPPAVPYWGKYTRHDDNRDINYAGLANQNLLKWYLEWHPPVIHDLHESVPFLYIFSGQSPQNTFLDPILWDELPMFSNFEKQRLTAYGMPGVWDHAYVDGWSPGYVAFMSSNHNGMMRFYEIFGNGGATTMHRTLTGGQGAGGAAAPEPAAASATEAPAAAAGGSRPAAAATPAAGPPATAAAGAPGGGNNYTTRQDYRPDPPYKDVMWSMRNNVNYAETGVLTALEFTSTIPQIVVGNFYRKSLNSIHTGETEAPYAYVIPSDNEDPTRVAFAVHILRMQGIEVGRAKADIKLSDGAYPAGSLVVKLNQPYGRLAHTLLSKQVDPNPELTTYDDAAWTLGLMTHTTIKESADKSALAIAVDAVDVYTAPSKIEKSASAVAYAVPDHGSPNLITLRFALKDADIQIAEKSFSEGKMTLPAGSFIIPAAAFDSLASAGKPLGLDAVALTAKPTVAMHKAGLPRIAMFSTWNGTQDVGWVRYAFDQYKIPYDLLYKEQVLKGDLRSKYDVLLIPTQARNAKQLINDIPKTKTPYAYVKDDKFKFLGDYGSSDDISGGIGLPGLMEFQKFVSAGGLMITLGSSSFLPPDFDLAPRVEATTTSARFYAPGPIVEAEIAQPDNPIFYGYSGKTLPVRWAAGPLLRMDADEDRRETMLRFTGGDKAVLSGLMNGAAEITRRPAIVKTPLDKGEIVMFVTNPIWRNQNIGEYRMLFNALLNYQNLDTPPPPAPAAGTGQGAGGGRRNRDQPPAATPPSPDNQ